MESTYSLENEHVEPKNACLEYDFPFQLRDFWVPAVNVQGCSVFGGMESPVDPVHWSGIPKKYQRPPTSSDRIHQQNLSLGGHTVDGWNPAPPDMIETL